MVEVTVISYVWTIVPKVGVKVMVEPFNTTKEIAGSNVLE